MFALSASCGLEKNDNFGYFQTMKKKWKFSRQSCFKQERVLWRWGNFWPLFSAFFFAFQKDSDEGWVAVSFVVTKPSFDTSFCAKKSSTFQSSKVREDEKQWIYQLIESSIHTGLLHCTFIFFHFLSFPEQNPNLKLQSEK